MAKPKPATARLCAISRSLARTRGVTVALEPFASRNSQIESSICCFRTMQLWRRRSGGHLRNGFPLQMRGADVNATSQLGEPAHRESFVDYATQVYRDIVRLLTHVNPPVREIDAYLQPRVGFSEVSDGACDPGCKSKGRHYLEFTLQLRLRPFVVRGYAACG